MSCLWWAVRRLLFVPVMAVLAVAATFWWLLTLLASLIAEPLLFLLRRHSPRWRPLRLATFAMLYTLGDCVALVCCLLVWAGCGFGLLLHRPRAEAVHHRMLATFLGGAVFAARVLFGFHLVVEEPRNSPADVRAAEGTRPLVVLARHAGPGGSFALVHVLLGRYGRAVRVVLKEQLRLDPALDVLLTRNHCAWIPWRAKPGQGVRAVRTTAEHLGEREALLLFPEGADWTPVRRLQAIGTLWRRGLVSRALAAMRMPHVLPPRPAGTLAALQGAPGADVLVFTHTGLDQLLDAASTWQALPLREPLRMTWWREPAAEVPRDSEDSIAAWLQETWGRIDAWVDAKTPED